MDFYFDVNIRIDEETYRWLQEKAGDRGLTVSEYIVLILRHLRDLSIAIEDCSPSWEGNGRGLW